MLYIPFWILLIIHAEVFWYYFILPFTVFIIEKILGSRLIKKARYGDIFITEVGLLPSGVGFCWYVFCIINKNSAISGLLHLICFCNIRTHSAIWGMLQIKCFSDITCIIYISITYLPSGACLRWFLWHLNKDINVMCHWSFAITTMRWKTSYFCYETFILFSPILTAFTFYF